MLELAALKLHTLNCIYTKHNEHKHENRKHVTLLKAIVDRTCTHTSKQHRTLDRQCTRVRSHLHYTCTVYII